MSGIVHYRRLQDLEIDAVSELARRVFDEFIGPFLSLEGREEFHKHATPQAIRQRHGSGDVTFVAERSGQIIGMLHLAHGEHIAMFFVDGSNQRQGIGRNLVGEAIKYALAQQPPARKLTVGSSPNAIKAYERMGFVAVGGELVEHGIRFVSMELELNSVTLANPMPPLQPPDTMHLLAAQGWLELGNHVEANEELERITPQNRAHPGVLEVRWAICAAAKKWEAALDIASALIQLMPHHSLGWINRSFALHELNRTAEARETLLPVVDKFPDEPALRYNLACYECRLGHLEQAKDWLEKAFRIGKARKIKSMALKDPDLEPLWKHIGQT
jgi:GNAT superfamily N-acetyltransferase